MAQTIKDCPHSIQSYWYFRDQITCEDGIIYKGTRLIIPKSERASTLKVLHMRHYAIDKMSLRARETVYWPGISEDIRSTYHLIGTVYRNYHRPALIITFIFPDLLPKILRTSSQERACPTRTYACLIKHYSK